MSSNEWFVGSAIYWCSRPELINKIKEPPNTCLDVGECSSRLSLEVQPKWKSVPVDPSSIPQLHCDCQLSVVLLSGCVCVGVFGVEEATLPALIQL